MFREKKSEFNDAVFNRLATRVTPEYYVLLLCCRSRVKHDTLEKITSIFESHAIDWQKLLFCAVQHRIFPLVYIHLKKVRSFVPKAIFDDLGAMYKTTSVRNLLLSKTLVLFLEQMEQAGITAIPFKGPVLAETIYGGFVLRSYGDLDILVPYVKIKEVVELFCASGYRPINNLTTEQLLFLCRVGKDCPLVHTASGIVVELHHEIGGILTTKWDTTTLEPFFINTQLLRHTVHAFLPEMLLVYLCVHGSRHFWYQLDFVCVVAEVIRNSPKLDFERVLQLAAECRCRTMVLLGLLLARRILKVELPGEVVALIEQKKSVRILVRKIEDRLFNHGLKLSRTLKYGEAIAYYFKVFDNAWDAFHYILKKIFKPDGYDLLWVTLPQRLWFLYRVIRPVRLVTKAVIK